MSRTIRFLVLTAVAVGTAFTGVAVAQTTAEASTTSAPASRPLASSEQDTAASERTDERHGRAAHTREAQQRSTRAAAVRRELLAAADSGEIAHSDAERVAADLAGYISGSRSFPESA